MPWRPVAGHQLIGEAPEEQYAAGTCTFGCKPVELIVSLCLCPAHVAMAVHEIAIDRHLIEHDQFAHVDSSLLLTQAIASNRSTEREEDLRHAVHPFSQHRCKAPLRGQITFGDGAETRDEHHPGPDALLFQREGVESRRLRLRAALCS